MSNNVVTDYLIRVRTLGDLHHERVKNEKVQEFIANHLEQLNTFFPPSLFPNLTSELLQSDLQFKLETPWAMSELYKKFRNLMFDIDVRDDPQIPDFPQDRVEIQIADDSTAARFVRFPFSEKTKFYDVDLLTKLENGVHMIPFEDACDLYSKIHAKVNNEFEESFENACGFMHLDKIRTIAEKYQTNTGGDLAYRMALSDVVRLNKQVLGKERVRNMFYMFLVEKYRNVFDDSDLQFFFKVY